MNDTTISDSLTGRRPLVTGAGRGIGAAVAARLAAAGADVTTVSRSGDTTLTADLATAEGAASVAAHVVAAGGIEILVDTVGGSHAGSGGFAHSTTSSGRPTSR